MARVLAAGSHTAGSLLLGGRAEQLAEPKVGIDKASVASTWRQRGWRCARLCRKARELQRPGQLSARTSVRSPRPRARARVIANSPAIRERLELELAQTRFCSLQRLVELRRA